MNILRISKCWLLFCVMFLNTVWFVEGIVNKTNGEGLKEVVYGDWLMVFRGESGNGMSVVESYMTPGIADETDRFLSDACLSIHGEDKCGRHYRHGVLDRWDTANVTKVKLELYKNGKSVAHIIFDGKGSTSTNWFNARTILSASWTDLRSSYRNYFEFFGVRNERFDRRLYISKSWGNGKCENDKSWMMVLEHGGECRYDNQSAYPAFLYSTFTTAALPRYLDKAEVLAIYISTPKTIHACPIHETKKTINVV